MKQLALPCLLLLQVMQAGAAHAYSAGVFGFSGKPPADSCTDCHSGTAPTVKLDGPSELAAGASAVYTFDVVTGASNREAGFDIATSDGTLGAIAQNTASFLNNGEISHKLPLGKAATVQVRFQLTAPATAGTLTLFATGLSADGDGNTDNDGTAATTFAVTVTGPADLAGVDLSGVDLAAPLADLSPAVDAISSATSPEPAPAPKLDLGPPRNEPKWACDCHLGPAVEIGALPLLLLAAMIAIALRRRSG